MKLNRKQYLMIALSVLAVLGSLFVAFSSNLLFGDIINIQAGFAHSTFFVSLPAIATALTMVTITLYLIRVYKHPHAVKSMMRLYSIILMVFNFIGVIGVILSAVIVYKNMFGNNPFPGYLILFLLLNLLFLAVGVLGFLYSRKLKEDEEKVKINFKYVMKTVGWVLFILLTFNRFGTLLVAPSYIYLRNFYMTFPFYIWLSVPLYLGVVVILNMLEIIDKKKTLLMTIIGLGINVALFIYIVIMASNDSSFIAAVSQTMPVDRMTSKPIEVLIHLLSYLGVGAVLLIKSLKKDKAE